MADRTDATRDWPRKVGYYWALRRRVVDGIEEKWCPKCREWWLTECYTRNRATFDGLHRICRACYSETRVDTKQNAHLPKHKPWRPWTVKAHG